MESAYQVCSSAAVAESRSIVAHLAASAASALVDALVLSRIFTCCAHIFPILGRRVGGLQ